MMSQWGGDIAIDTKQSCDQQLRSFTQDLGNLLRKTQITHHRIKPNIKHAKIVIIALAV